MRRWAWLASALVIGLAVGAPVASAQPPAEDSVTGSATTGTLPSTLAEFTFDVHSSPSGDNPTGTVRVSFLSGPVAAVDITCLNVSANRASMFAVAPPNTTGVAGLVISVEDNGPAQDALDWRAVPAVPADCPVPDDVVEPVASGDITVTDTQPLPSSKDQCKNGGWKTYGAFKNQGDCVSFVVHQAIKACVFEREAIGRGAFREKYGIGRFDLFSMLRCIHRRVDG